MKRAKLSVVILTYNESIHTKRAIENVINWCNEVIVLDSHSTDNTVEIAENNGAKVFFRQFDNYKNQRNYAIHELPLKNEWMLFLDADEYLSEELKEEISRTLANEVMHVGFLMKRKFIFRGKWIRFGGYYPIWILRLFNRKAANVDREINEHVSVNGTTGSLTNNFFDHNLKPIADWIEKHNRYSKFEAEQFILDDKIKKDGLKDLNAKLNGDSIQRKRWIRFYIWNSLPVFTRPFIYFVWCYFVRLGFLDGMQGFIYHYLHSFWYPFVTDIKYLEIKNKIKNQQ